LVTASAGATVTDLFVEAGLVQSRSEARRAVAEGGAYLNNERVDDPEYVPNVGDYLGGEVLVLRRGKKSFAGVAAP
jgi:tyrosyl-tRNA synthetase